MKNRAAAGLNSVENDDARMSSIVESSNDAIYSISLEGDILSWNPGATRIYGFTGEEMRGRHLSFIVSSGRRDEFSKILETVKEGLAVANFLTTHKTKQEDEIILSLTVSPIKDDSGRVARAVVIARDISESEKAKIVKEALWAEKNEFLDRLRIQLTSIPIACILTDEQFQFTYWNRAAEKTFGFSFKEVEGRRAEENIVPPSEIPSLLNIDQRLVRGDLKGSEAILANNVRKDGRIIICEWYNTPLHDPRGKFQGLMSMVMDVTERRKTEEVRSQLAAILQQTTDAVIGSDLEGRIFSWNRGAETMLGYLLEDILGESTALLVPSDRKEEMEKVRDLATKEQNVSNYETVMLKKDGDLVEVSVTLSPIKDARGNIIGVSAISRDITERKRAEESMKKNEAFNEAWATKGIKEALKLRDKGTDPTFTQV